MMPLTQISGGSPDHLQTRTASSGQKQLLEAPGVSVENSGGRISPVTSLAMEWHPLSSVLVVFFSKFQSWPQKFEVHTCKIILVLGIFWQWYCTGFFRKKHVSQMRTSRYPLIVFGQLFASTHCWLRRFPAEPSFCRSSGGGRAELHRETRQM